MYFNSTQRFIGFFDGEKEARVALMQVDDLYKHGDRLKATVARYDGAKAAPPKE
jgi:hypothetical protein